MNDGFFVFIVLYPNFKQQVSTDMGCNAIKKVRLIFFFELYFDLCSIFAYVFNQL
jgi:hypothetical protein